MTRLGIVYLVGAGPGDPELITVRGLKCLQRAEILVYDRLANAALIADAPASAIRYNVGKSPGRLNLSQSAINNLLVREARRGKTVVRLKGGDPFIFGRGGEECLALASAGLPYEVVPGISSASAAPAYAGIPLTHRGMARSVAFVIGHTCELDATELDWDSVAHVDTLVILMGVRNLPTIVQQLLQCGRAAKTPVAAVRWGTTNKQSLVTGTLETIVKRARSLQPPAIIVVGEVVRLQPELEWFPAISTALEADSAFTAPTVDSLTKTYSTNNLIRMETH